MSPTIFVQEPGTVRQPGGACFSVEQIEKLRARAEIPEADGLRFLEHFTLGCRSCRWASLEAELISPKTIRPQSSPPTLV